MRKQIQTIICAGIILSSIIFLSGCTQPPQFRVFIQRTQEGFESIFDAMTHAIDGDTIICEKGVFHESVRVNRSITIQGAGVNQTIITADSKGDVITIVAHGVTIKDCTLTQAGNLTYPEIDAGIDIQGHDIHVERVSIIDSNYAVYAYRRINITLNDINIINNTQRGIYLNTGNGISISNAYVENNTFGIYWNGITNSSIQSSQIIGHKETGLYLGAQSNYNDIYDNTITDNNYGIHVKGSINNTVSQNLFLSNTRGIYFCCGGKDTLVYLNVFLTNLEHAYGFPINQFDNGSKGNYWDDYTGVDENNDGIGDTPYNATSTEEYGPSNYDYYPLMSPNQ
jgi:nitrous oxidase accessory protein